MVFANTLQLLVSLRGGFRQRACCLQPTLKSGEPLDGDWASYVEDHLAGYITLDDTARQFHVSASTAVSAVLARMGATYLGDPAALIATRRPEGTALILWLNCGFRSISAYRPSSRKASPHLASETL